MSGFFTSPTLRLFSSWTYSADVTQVDFTGLGGVGDIIVIARGVVLGTSGRLSLRVGISGTFYETSGQYVNVSTAGVESDTNGLAFYDTASTSARSGIATIRGANIAGIPKIMECLNDTNDAQQRVRLFVADIVNPIDAIRVIPGGGGNITAGSLHVLVR